MTDLPPPLRLTPNPAWRSYPGGQVLRSFRGEPNTPDNHFPEDWLASTVLARNGVNSCGPREGISLVEWNGRPTELAAVMRDTDAYAMRSSVGPRSLGVLLKLLDSAERLHLQAHPSDDFVSRKLEGTKGKTECWYILSTRDTDSHIYLGFQRPPSMSRWKQMIETQDIDSMLACFDPIPVRPGDCYVVPAGTPHAIGKGIFMLELQQPSDWVVRCEFTVGGHTLPPAARFMGLTLDEILEVFDYAACPSDQFCQQPRIVASSDRFSNEEIIEPPYHSFFRLNRLRGSGSASWEMCDAAVLVVTEGCGQLKLNGYSLDIKSGESWLLPASPREAQWAPGTSSWQLLLARTPLPSSSLS